MTKSRKLCVCLSSRRRQQKIYTSTHTYTRSAIIYYAPQCRSLLLLFFFLLETVKSSVKVSQSNFVRLCLFFYLFSFELCVSLFYDLLRPHLQQQMIVVVVLLSPNMLNFGGCRRWNRGGETDLPIITIQSNCFFFSTSFSPSIFYYCYYSFSLSFSVCCLLLQVQHTASRVSQVPLTDLFPFLIARFFLFFFSPSSSSLSTTPM